MNNSRFLFRTLLRKWCGILQQQRKGHIVPTVAMVPSFIAITMTPPNGRSTSGGPTRNNMGVALLLAGTTSMMASSKSLCEQEISNDTVATDDAESNNNKTNPRKHKRKWNPSAANKEDVDALVKKVLNDPAINSPLIPDAIETKLYKATIQLTLGVFYNLLNKLNGKSIFTHEIQLTTTDYHGSIQSSTTGKSQPNYSPQLQQINDKVLEEVTERLLANPSINSQIIPDVVEREMYVNCLKVIFRSLMVVCENFRITICGHDIRLQMEPAQLERSALKASSSMSMIDLDSLREFAKKAGIDETSTSDLSWWQRWSFQQEVMTVYYAALYGLILGIVDDIMANTKIQILSDDITMDLVPPQPNTELKVESINSTGTAPSSVPVAAFGVASFAAGVGTGVATMAVLQGRR